MIHRRSRDLPSQEESIDRNHSFIHSFIRDPSESIMEWVDALVMAVAGVLAVAHMARHIQSWKATKLRLAPGPPGWPVLGNLLLFGGPFPPLELAKLAGRYGPVMSLRMGSQRALVISSGEAAREVLKVQDHNFASRPRLSAVDSFTFLEGSFAFSPSTPRHRSLRKLVLSELLAPKKVREGEGQRSAEVRAAVRSLLQQEGGGGGGGEAADVHVTCTSVTLNIMTHVIMGRRFCRFRGGQAADPEAAEFMEVVREANQVLGIKMYGDYIPALAWLDGLLHRGRIQRCKTRLSRFLDAAIAEHRQKKKLSAAGPGAPTGTADFIDALLAIDDEAGIDKDKVIKGLVGDVLFAGVDTPAATAEWAMAELLKNPGCMREAQAELDAVVGRARAVEEGDLAGLPYVRGVMQETLRLHPVAPLLVPHQNSAACEVGGFHVPARTTVLVNAWAIHRGGSAYPDPHRFRPDRFVGGSRGDVDDAQGLTGLSLDLIPFGAGRRMCPAATFGLSVATLMLATLLHSFDWALPGGQTADDLDMSGQFGLTVPKKHHLLAVPSPRLPLHLY